MSTTIHPQALATTSQTPSLVRNPAALLGWVLVAVSLALATVVAVRALDSDGDAVGAPWYAVEHGSIAAMDHVAELRARNQPFAVEAGSIVAIDHAADAVRAPWYAVEHGSIAATDHAAAAALPWYSVEHGSIAATDHAAAAALPWYSVEHGSIASIDHATDDR